MRGWRMTPSPSLMRPDRSHALDEAYLLVCWYAKVRLELCCYNFHCYPSAFALPRVSWT